DDIYAGEVEATGRRVVQPKMSREVFAGDEIHAWHTHPEGELPEQFSQGEYSPPVGHEPGPGHVNPDDPGDYANTQLHAKFFENDSIRTYLLAPSRNLKSIGVNGPMPSGTPHGSVWIPRAAPAAGGMIGGASAGPMVRRWFE